MVHRLFALSASLILLFVDDMIACLIDDPIWQTKRCCFNYRNESGQCIECKPGTYGLDCSSPCPGGFYGDLCRLACDCGPYEHCDAQVGCIYNNDTSNATTQDDQTTLEATTTPMTTTTTTTIKSTTIKSTTSHVELSSFVLGMTSTGIFVVFLAIVFIIANRTASCGVRRSDSSTPRQDDDNIDLGYVEPINDTKMATNPAKFDDEIENSGYLTLMEIA